MIDTTVKTYHGVSSCLRRGDLISSGYYYDEAEYDEAEYEDCVPLLIVLYENQFAWEVEYGSTHRTSDESSWADGVMELLDHRMGNLFDELIDKWDSEPKIPKGLMLYCFEPSRGREFFFFNSCGSGLDCFKRVGSWFKGIIEALWVC